MTDVGGVTAFPQNQARNRRNQPQYDYVVAWLPHDAARQPVELAGWVGLVASRSGIVRLVLPCPTLEEVLEDIQPPASWRLSWSPLLCRTYWQLRALLSGRRRGFTLPVDLSGLTPFRAQVLRLAASIPWGETRSYAELAAEAGSPGAARAVGQAMAHNPVPLLVPCHRVIGGDGGMVGFGGGVNRKRALLRLEVAQDTP